MKLIFFLFKSLKQTFRVVSHYVMKKRKKKQMEKKLIKNLYILNFELLL